MNPKFWLTVIAFITIMQMGMAQDDTTRLTLTFIGDVMGHDTQIKDAYNADSLYYDYTHVFQYLKPSMSRADFTIANLEVVLGITPYKGYPLFSSPPALAAALKEAGVDAMVTANNHSCDRGKKGILRTIHILDSLGISRTGTFKDTTDQKLNQPMILEKNGIRVAVLNYTYGTNGLPIPAPTVVNMIDKERIAADLTAAKKSIVDKVVVFIHWGAEYQRSPDQEQIELGKYLTENGADIIIGSHPHVIQKMVFEEDRFIAYSLGNFVSNQRKRYTDGGTMVHLTLARSGDQTWIDTAGYQLTWVYTPVVGGKKQFYVLPAAEYKDSADFFTGHAAEYEALKTFLKDSQALLKKENINVGAWEWEPVVPEETEP